MTARPGRPDLRPHRGRGGFIVLGPLIVFVCVLVVMVVAGKVLYPEPRGIYRQTPAPRLEFAAASAEVYSAGRLVRRLEPGDSVWVVRLANGEAVVFEDSAGRRPTGVTRGLLRARG